MIITCPSCQSRFNVDATKLGREGRSVRCGKCGERWHQTAPEPEVEPPIEPAIEIEADEARALFGMVEGDRPEAVAPPESLFEKLSTPPPDRPKPSAPVDTWVTPVSEAPLQALKSDKAPVKAPARAEPRAPKMTRFRPAASPLTWGAVVLALLVLGLAVVQGRGWITQRIPAAERVYQQLGLGDRPGSGLTLREVSSERLLVDGADSLVIEGVIANPGAATLAVPSIEARFANGEAHEIAIEAESSTLAPGEETRFKITLPTPPESGELSLHFLGSR